MPEVSLTGFVIVMAVAFAVPLVLGLLPRLRVPGPVLEILIGIMIGPSLLGWVEFDVALQVLSVIGLAFLLFLAGLEIDVERLRGGLLISASGGFVLSFALALLVGLVLGAVALIESPLLVAILFTATGLGVIAPVLKDAGQAGTEFGQMVLASASIADFGAVILLSLFFSRESTGTGAQLLLLGGLILLAVVVGEALAQLGHSARLSAALMRLQDTSAQIRVRGAVLLLAGFIWFAQRLGLEVILGAFVAGVILKLVDRDAVDAHPQFLVKLDALGFGMFVPIFFVSSGVRFDAAALFDDPSALGAIPVFLLALLVIHGLPVLRVARRLGPRRTGAAALLQATSLPFIVAAAQIGTELGALSSATAAALVAAGLLSVLLFPLLALALLRTADADVAHVATR